MAQQNPAEMDIRVLQFHVRHRHMTEAEIEIELQKLPDDAQHGIETAVSFVSGWNGKGRVERPD